MSKNRYINILLIEDNPGDVRLTMEALSEYKELKKMQNVFFDLTIITDGYRVEEYFLRDIELDENVTPELIILDLNLPHFSGRTILSEFRNHSLIKSIPIVVLSTSNAESDIKMCYEHGVNSYLNKPVDFDSFFNLISTMVDYWLFYNSSPISEIKKKRNEED